MLEYVAIVISSLSVFYAFLVWRSLHRIEVAVRRAFGEKALIMHSSKKAEKFQKELLEQMLPQVLTQIHPLAGLLTPFIRNFMENTDLKPSDVLGLIQAAQNLFSTFKVQKNLNEEKSESKLLHQLFGVVNGKEKTQKEEEKS